jgi:hypothetical protein
MYIISIEDPGPEFDLILDAWYYHYKEEMEFSKWCEKHHIEYFGEDENPGYPIELRFKSEKDFLQFKLKYL